MAVGISREVSHTEMDNSNDFLYTRTPWVDASVAYQHISKHKARGRKTSLWIRKKVQSQLTHLGDFLHRNAGKVIFVALLVAATFCVGLKSSNLVTDIEKLWIEVDGRLERELEYVTKTLGEGAGTTNQILIQTAKENEKGNLLNAPSLLTHLEILKEATSVSVEIFDTSWHLSDLCFASNFPLLEDKLIDQIFEKLQPCMIITPLDCFWEGSQLLGPNYPVRIPGFGDRKWSNLNPQAIIEKIEGIGYSSYFFAMDTFKKFMKRAGITTAYQQKPCLNPLDPECPSTAPNKNSSKLPNIGAELTGGCYGFASKYLHWPEDLIVGGVEKNKTHHIVRAEALQSVVQLMGGKDLFEYWMDDWKVHAMDWSVEKADLILDAWVHKFAKKVEEATAKRKSEAKSVSLHPFSSASLEDLLKKISQISISRISIGYIIMAIYACVVVMQPSNKCQSSVGLAISGIIVLSGGIASGLGICSLLGLPINAATTQVLPFLSLSLGLNHMFLMIYTVNEVPLSQEQQYFPITEVLRRSGMSVIVGSFCNAVTFLCASVIPIPALRVLCLQAAIVILVMLAATLFVFPAVITFDIRRRIARRLDVLCCYRTERVQPADARTMSNTPSSNKCQERWVGIESIEYGEPAKPPTKKPALTRFLGCGSEWLKEAYHTHFLQSRFKGIVIILFFVSIGISIWASTKIPYGLDMTDIVPRGTSESQFLNAQHKYFGFYNMFAVTQGNLEYPTKQKLLHEYHGAFNLVPWIIKNDDGGVPDSWLILFRDWLINLQKAFDADFNKGHITEEGWNHNASHDAIFAYKLLVQTGHVDHPVDKSLVSQIRLVDEEGVINSKAFYNYLTAWASNDPFGYSASQADIRPTPRSWLHDPADYDLKIPKSSPIVYAQFPFYLSGLDDTSVITSMITMVRSICRKYEDLGIPNFPTGVPFTFWEQYTNLSKYFFLILAATLGSIWIIVSMVLANPLLGFFLVIMCFGLVSQVGGIIAVLGLKMSAIPASLLTMSVAFCSQFCLQILVGFTTCNGDRTHRVMMTLKYCSRPIIQGVGASLLATVLLLFSEFDFIKSYFFSILAAVSIFGFIDALIILPFMLSCFGPSPDLVPFENPEIAPPPSPKPPPSPHPIHRSYNRKQRQNNRSSSSRNLRVLPTHHGSNLSLTTITEEPVSGASMESRKSYTTTPEILVEPQVVVETTTGQKSGSSSPTESVVISDAGHVTTVTATAKVKVEVHKPYPQMGYPDCHQYHKCTHEESERRSSSSSNSSSSTSSCKCTKYSSAR